MSRPIELLSPARDLQCGIEAVRHGADAIYIGAPRFGARAAAGNALEDIARLVDFAHPFGVRIYVTLNTLLHDDELSAAQALIDDLAAIQVDALITQDPRIRPLIPSEALSEETPNNLFSPIPLHSSTQMDNRTADDIRRRLEAGYRQTVLARELSLDDIRAIHEAVPQMPLEVFVHGALCVSYSGRCYASEYCFGRSANRGECAQFCRLPFDLIDAEGHIIEHQRHLLSLRDMNRSADLEALMDAGVTSFKIEGRLKDVAYVKNITAYYRQRIDAILARRPDEFHRASQGTSVFTFTPQPQKSFNRGFTDYFLHGRTSDMACHATPKSIGEPVGTVKDIQTASFAVSGTVTFANGDGLCYFTPDGRLVGFRVNRVDTQGRLYPAAPTALSNLRKGAHLYRNFDAAFERQLSRPTAERRIAVRWSIEDTTSTDDGTDVPVQGFRLTLTSEDHRSVTRFFAHPHEKARTPQADNLRRQLIRLGDTVFTATEQDVDIHFTDNWFLPSSVLADWRRQITDALHAHTFCTECVHLPAFTCTPSAPHVHTWPPLMTCRYCIRHALGHCLKDPTGKRPPLKEPLSLVLADGRRFPLQFNCKDCEMLVLAPSMS